MFVLHDVGIDAAVWHLGCFEFHVLSRYEDAPRIIWKHEACSEVCMVRTCPSRGINQPIKFTTYSSTSIKRF